MGETIQSLLRRLFHQNVSSIFVPLLAIVGIIWVLSLFGIVPTIWSAVAAAVVAVLLAVIQIAQWFPPESTKARQEMDRLIQLYKGVRYYTSPSKEKTRNMDNVMKSMRGQAQRAKYTSQEMRSFLLSNDEGERLAGLAILQWLEKVDRQNVRYFEQMLPLMREPRSPFEHYHSLERLRAVKPDLSNQQQDKLREAVRNHRYDRDADSDKWPDFCRWILGEGENKCE